MLQASNSLWFHQESWLLRKIGPNIGPLLLSFCCLITSGMCLLTTRLVKKIGYVSLIAVHYVTLCIFLLIHLYPTIWLLLPVYALLGLTLGPAWICKWSLVVFFASRISCGQHECSSATAMMNETGDDHKIFCNRNERVRRLARWFHAVQDMGIFIGALIASIIISCAANESGCFYKNKFLNDSISISRDSSNSSVSTTEILLNTLNVTNGGIDISNLSRRNFLPNELTSTLNNLKLNDAINTDIVSTKATNDDFTQSITATEPSSNNEMNIFKLYQESMFSQHDELLDSLYNTNERGIRICGAGSCPTWNYHDTNTTEEYNWFTYSGTIPMTIFYLLLALVALTLSCLSQQVDNTLKYENIKGITDTLLFACPMAYFIGTEQGYVLGGFTRVSIIIIFNSIC